MVFDRFRNDIGLVDRFNLVLSRGTAGFGWCDEVIEVGFREVFFTERFLLFIELTIHPQRRRHLLALSLDLTILLSQVALRNVISKRLADLRLF